MTLNIELLVYILNDSYFITFIDQQVNGNTHIAGLSHKQTYFNIQVEYTKPEFF